MDNKSKLVIHSLNIYEKIVVQTTGSDNSAPPSFYHVYISLSIKKVFKSAKEHIFSLAMDTERCIALSYASFFLGGGGGGFLFTG